MDWAPSEPAQVQVSEDWMAPQQPQQTKPKSQVPQGQEQPEWMQVTEEDCQKVPPEEEEVWKEAFDLFDMNKDGHISFNEFTSIVRGVGYNPSNKMLQMAYTEMDQDKNGILEFNDFKIMMLRISKATAKDRADDLLQAFRVLDSDKNGFIDKKELMSLLTTFGEVLSEEEVQEMVKIADRNEDGLIDYKEFINFYNLPVFGSKTMGQR